MLCSSEDDHWVRLPRNQNVRNYEDPFLIIVVVLSVLFAADSSNRNCIVGPKAEWVYYSYNFSFILPLVISYVSKTLRSLVSNKTKESV